MSHNVLAFLTFRANRAQFADVYLRHINEDDEIPEIGVPTVQGVSDNIGTLAERCQTLELTDVEMEELEQVGAPDPVDVFVTPEQLSEGLLTLSLMPRSRWQTLLNLDTIRVSLPTL
jgi:U3 small nucleolar RNA-associated protein 21